MSDYYNIKLEAKVTNFNAALQLFFDELRRIHSWERRMTIKELKSRGYNGNQIAKIMHVSRVAIYADLNSLKKATGSPSQASDESRTACVPPVARELKSKKERKNND